MTSNFWLLVVYCALVLVASLAGGWLPMMVRLTHTRLQAAISFVDASGKGHVLVLGGAKRASPGRASAAVVYY